MKLLVDHLRRLFPAASGTTLKRMVEAGRVKVNGRLARRLKEMVDAGARIEVAGKADVAAAKRVNPPSLAPLQLVHEDADVLVVVKPAGLLTSTVPNEKRPTAIAIVRRYLSATDPAARAGVIHRLDRDASGLLVFSKNHAAYESLKRQFFEHLVERVYLAVVHGTPQPRQGRIESHLVERADGIAHSTRQRGRGQLAITDYVVVRESEGVALVRVTLHTGRKHQIRAHLSERGHPILGDSLYTQPSAIRLRAGRLMLAAIVLGFAHPRTAQPLRFEIPAPDELAAMLRRM